MKNTKHIITHRCDELLEYNQSFYKPCFIHFDKWSQNENRTWILKTLESDADDWDIRYMWNVAKIKYCPFCNAKLEAPFTLMESGKN